MLKDYWDRKYTECPECGRKQKTRQFTATFHCKYDDCDYQEHEYKGAVKREKMAKGMVKEIVEYLLVSDEEYTEPLPSIYFPKLAGGTYEIRMENVCAGWYNPSDHSINIPLKAFYLPKKEIIEVCAHESAHVPIFPFLSHRDITGGHTEQWHYKYMDYRRKAFGKFADFANEQDEGAKYTVGMTKEKYKQWYGYDLEDLIYNPYEDD